MTKQETIKLLDILITFFKDYNKMLDEMDERIEKIKQSE